MTTIWSFLTGLNLSLVLAIKQGVAWILNSRKVLKPNPKSLTMIVSSLPMKPNDKWIVDPSARTIRQLPNAIVPWQVTITAVIINTVQRVFLSYFESTWNVKSSALESVLQLRSKASRLLLSRVVILRNRWLFGSYLEISQTPKMTGFSLISETGGALGLFVGITFLRLFGVFIRFIGSFFINLHNYYIWIGIFLFKTGNQFNMHL